MKILHLLLLFIITISVSSQEVEDYIYESPYVRHFTYKEYNMHTQCWSSTQDSIGNLYMANNNGISIYNGVNWSSIDLFWAWSIENIKNTIYIGSYDISYLLYDNQYLTPKVKKIFIDTAKYNISKKIFKLSFKTKNSVFYSNRHNLIQIKDKKFANAYNVKKANVFTYNDKVFIQKNNSIKSTDNIAIQGLNSVKIIYKILKIDNKAYIFYKGNNIYSADIDKENEYKFKNLKIEYEFKNTDYLSSYNIKKIDNQIIMALNSGGVFIYNVKTKKELFINKSSNKTIGIVNSISITNNKNIIANTDNGFYLINYNSPIKYLKQNKQIKSIVTSILNYSGYKYIATLDGVYKLKQQGESNKYSITKLNKTYNSYLQLSIHNNELYISSRDGVSIIKNDKIQLLTNDDIAFSYYFSEQNPDILYVGTSNSLNIYKKTNGKYNKIYSINDLATNVNSLLEFNNNLWFLYDNTKVAALSIKNDEYKSMKVYDLQNPALNIYTINNRLFVTSDEGEVGHYYDYKTDKFIPWKKFIDTSKQPSEYFSLYTKLNNNEFFAVSCLDGVFAKIVPTDSTTNFIKKPYKSIGADQYFSTFYDSTLNKIFVGGSGFILSIDNKNIDIPNINNYKTHIRKIIINDTIIKPLKNLKQKSKIKFLFSSNSIYKSEQTYYSYKLEGFDNNWTEWTKEAFASYTNLNYGEYTFKVKSKNIYKQISDITQYSFTIESAFYQTITARIIGVLLIILLMYFIIYLNSKRLKKANKKLEKQVEERTKEIQKLSIVAQETDNSVLIYDKNGDLEWINDGEIKNFGYTLEQIWKNFGRNILDISFYPKIEEVVSELRKTKRSVYYNSSGVRKNNDIIWTRTTLTPILDDNHNITKIIAIDSDITELKIAEEKISYQNESINNSIKYAKKIQTAVLPLFSKIKSNVEDAFILYKPKNIVGGDFYWFFTNNKNKTIIISADSTGHGVPGGFMSMIGNTILNNIIKEKNIMSPSIILDLLNKEINASVNNDIGQVDGMDISVILINKEENIVELATANQSIFFIKNNEVNEFYGNIWSIGETLGKEDTDNYTSKQYKLNEISHIYLTTDGYYDQFGGGNDKKIMKNVFVDLIQTNYTLPLNKQKEKFESYLNNWKKDNEQTDDIQVIGIKL